jgi:hypothetical protein
MMNVTYEYTVSVTVPDCAETNLLETEGVTRQALDELVEDYEQSSITLTSIVPEFVDPDEDDE